MSAEEFDISSNPPTRQFRDNFVQAWRLSPYRILTVAVITSLGAAKAAASQQDHAVVGNTLDWILGVLVATG
jgi:hypothetical protein